MHHMGTMAGEATTYCAASHSPAPFVCHPPPAPKSPTFGKLLYLHVVMTDNVLRVGCRLRPGSGVVLRGQVCRSEWMRLPIGPQPTER